MRTYIAAIVSFITQPVVAIVGALVIGAALIGYVNLSTNVQATGVYATASTSPITQTVTASGQVDAAHSTSLAFQTGGQIARINVQVGQHVEAGQVLLTLDAASANAALSGAQANLQVQQAKLASLQSGTRPQQLSIDQSNAVQAQQALANALQGAYVAADDAVHAQADQVFLNPRTSNATLALQVPNATLVNTIQQERVALQPIFASWASAAASTSPTVAQANLNTIITFLNNVAAAISETPAGGSTSQTTLSAYLTSVNQGRAEVTKALSELTAADTAYKQAQGALTLAQAGATPQDISAQQAAVSAAEAAVQSAEVQLSNTQLRAPVSGTITAQNANPGETVAPGAPLVSMVADGKYEVKLQVAQNDIGKVALGDSAAVSFDAYPNVLFPAKVTTVNPAATVQNGVPAYGVTVTFTQPDNRIKAGMSATAAITTATVQNALQVPSSAIITNGTQQFVYVKGVNGPVRTQVTTGISSASGSTQITSGIQAGTAVLTFGSSAGN